MTYAGLALIILGWCLQLLSKDKKIKVSFIIVYSLGVALLSIDGFMSNLPIMASLNLVSFIVAMAVFLKVRK